MGRELFSSLSLLDWLLSQAGARVRGFSKVFYSGLTTIALAREILRIVIQYPTLSGLYHVTGARISKYELLCLFRDAYHVPVEIEPFEGVVSDRSMRSDAYRQVTGFAPASWRDMVDELARDPTPYDRFRSANAGVTVGLGRG